MKHLSAAHLRLCMGALPAPTRLFLRHLFECPVCREAAAPGLADDAAACTAGQCAGFEVQPGEEPDERYRQIFDDFERRFAEAQAREAGERRRAAALLDELLAQSPVQWYRRLQQEPGLASVALAEALLDSSRRTLPGQPSAAEARARFVLLLLDQVDARRRADSMILRLRVRAWAVLGHALALARDWTGAEDAFATGGQLVPEHLGSEEEAELLERHSLCLYEQGRPGQALAQLTRAAELYGELGDLPRARAALEKLGLLCFDLGDLPRSCGYLAWALAIAQQLGHESATGALRHQLAWALLADDQVEAAREVLAPASLSAARREELPKLLLLLDRGPEDPQEGMAALESEIARAHARGEAFQVGLYAVLIARESLRGQPLPEPGRLTGYLLAAAESPQLTVEARASLRRLAEALEKGDLTLPLLIHTVQNLRYADEAEGNGTLDP